MNSALNNRYSRQISLPEIGVEGQARLAAARVLLVGVGGLGSPIATYLAAAGVGTLGLCDADVVSESNLQRQVLYTEAEIGLPKTECAARRLTAINSTINVVCHPCRLTADNASDIISQYDYVVDGCDNFATRYIIDDTCRRLGTTYVYGAITDFEGQVAVFDYHHGIGYSTLYPDREYYANCRRSTPAPVIGTTPAIVGAIEANQLIQLICHYGSPAIDTLICINLLNMEVNKLIIDN